jgi:hypothetical protein
MLAAFPLIDSHLPFPGCYLSKCKHVGRAGGPIPQSWVEKRGSLLVTGSSSGAFRRNSTIRYFYCIVSGALLEMDGGQSHSQCVNLWGFHCVHRTLYSPQTARSRRTWLEIAHCHVTFLIPYLSPLMELNQAWDMQSRFVPRDHSYVHS